MIWSDVTVITAAIPNRIATYLPLCIASVRRQTRPPIEHRIGIDHLHRGHGPIITALTAHLDTRGLVLLADDDELYPTHLERLIAVAIDTGAHVVYPYADLSTWPEGSVQRAVINRPWDIHSPRELARSNWIPGGGVLIDTELWRMAGGVSSAPERFHDSDWHLWRALLAAGATFTCVPEELWLYRCHAHQLQAMVDGRRATREDVIG
jgi:hypothetical protein